ncbi:hypothetical protein JVT61DRAFT_14650 [Boletus reticuloceps]|uniref:Uncharacterized protein n=1 Tax=Boletus reticuloceps TaxID=495285 RepID=A0A8I3ABY6_9AGAM|nr:hypothetical protein JVT61DRAFT_14650 [Boletus reticuloceps]
MNQPSNACGSLIPANHLPILRLHVDHSHNPTQATTQPQSPPGPPMDTLSDNSYNQIPEDFDIPPQLDSDLPFAGNVEYHLCTPQVFPGGRTFMGNFFADKYGLLRHENLFYPFASGADWQLGSWLLRSGLSMAAIDSFLSLDLIKSLPILFQSARQLHLRTEMLPSGPRWKSLAMHPSVPTKRAVTLYHRDPIECLQTLLSHPLFQRHISFVPCKVWSTAARLVCVYDDWLSGDHAWELQSSIPAGATLLGVTLSSDKTNISVMSGNCMAHPLLISLANIDPNICCKGSLHGHLLLALLPVPSFIHKKSRVHGLLSDRLFHQCLDHVTSSESCRFPWGHDE